MAEEILIRVQLVKYYIFFFVFVLTDFCSGWEFIDSRKKLDHFKDDRRTIMVCSPGRSGSTLLADTFDKVAKHRKILKSHLLPPKGAWKGKIIFIYSNPDKAAESILHRSLENSSWGMHFDHVETSDLKWFREVGNTVDQTLEKNLLAYDALGTEEH